MHYATERPSWDEFFILLALIFSSRGTCDRLRTGCVFVKNKRVVGAGYNGSIAGSKETCDENGHIMIDDHCVRNLHGEDNAESNAISKLDGATAYIIATPCPKCVRKMLQDGVRRIVYVGAYDNGPGKDLIFKFCEEKKVPLEQFASDPKDIAAIFQKVFRRLKGPGGLFKPLNNLELLLDYKLNVINAMKDGVWIVFEGGEKAGKSTQVERLLGYLIGKGYPVLGAKEPPYPDDEIPNFKLEIEKLDPADPQLREKEFELFEKIRKIYHEKRIEPALESGKIVVEDRCCDSTSAYQGHGRGMNLDKIREANREAVFGRVPDLTIVLNVRPSVMVERIRKDDETRLTRFEREGLEFHEKVTKGFLVEAVRDPKRYLILPADEDKDKLTVMIQKGINEKLGL